MQENRHGRREKTSTKMGADKKSPKMQRQRQYLFFSRQGSAENVDLEKEEGFSCGILRR